MVRHYRAARPEGDRPTYLGAAPNSQVSASQVPYRYRAEVAPSGRRALLTVFAVRFAGRPASPRKSQSKSQHRPTSGDAQRRQATVKPGRVPTERHRATSSDARNVTGGQGVAGSNPAVPTGR